MAETRSALKPLKARRSLTEDVTEALRALVTGGQQPAGSRLPTESQLVAHFGVSRTVVREAIARLASAGLVESRQGSGVYVRAPNAEMLFRIDPGVLDGSGRAVLAIVELRRGIEGEAAALAALRCGRAGLAAIQAALVNITRAEVAGADALDADMAFHRAIVRATGNPHYPALWDFIAQFIRGAMRTTRANEARRPEFAAQVRAEHRAIFDAIAARDSRAARAAALEHSEMAVERLRRAGALSRGAGAGSGAKTAPRPSRGGASSAGRT